MSARVRVMVRVTMMARIRMSVRVTVRDSVR